MSGGINSIGSGAGLSAGLSAGASAGTDAGAGGASFADVLKGQINEVVRLQQDASKAVQDVALGNTDDVTGMMTAMAKSDVAFKTLLAIRTKLMEAYDEVKNIPI